MRGGGRDSFGGFGGSFGGSFNGRNGSPSGFIENQQLSQPKESHGPEIDSHDEKEGEGEGEGEAEKKGNLGKHDRSSSKAETEVSSPREGRNRKLQNINVTTMLNNGQWQPRTCSYSFHSSSFTSSKTRRTRSNGLTHEESKEANTATREAGHRISRSLYNKGHAVSRKLNSDGRNDTTQILHNSNEDESADVEQSLSSNARRQLPGRSGSFGSSGLVNREQSMKLPATDLSPSRLQTESPRGTKAALNVTGHSSRT